MICSDGWSRFRGACGWSTKSGVELTKPCRWSPEWMLQAIPLSVVEEHRRTMVLASMVDFCKFASYAGWKWQIIEGNSWQKKWKDIQILRQKRAIHFPTHFLRCCAPPPSPLASPVPRDIKGPTPSIDEETGWTRSELGVLSSLASSCIKMYQVGNPLRYTTIECLYWFICKST